MDRIEHETYYRNRNFITAVFAGYLRLVKWLAIIILGFCAIAIVLLMIGQLFAPATPTISKADVKEVITGPCERTFFDQKLMADVTPPDRKRCVVTMINPNGTEWTVTRVVPMTDWQWAEMQDDG